MKNYFKYIGGFLVIVLIGAGVLWGVQEYRYRKSPEYQAMKYFEDLKKQYENDTYGGDTPEETLRLFIDALKKGDVELASKYFVVEKWEEWVNKLTIAKENNNLGLFIDEAQKADKGKEIVPGNYLFTIVGDEGIAEFVISLLKNEATGKWKIESL